MRIVLTKVTQAAVEIQSVVHSQIKNGLLVLVGITKGDNFAAAQRAAQKVLRVRAFPQQTDKQQHWKLSVSDLKYQILVVSQFTLYADLKKKNKPDFHRALNPKEAQPIYNHFLSSLRQKYAADLVKAGVFGAMMKVSSVNDGPVTFLYDLDCDQKEAS